MKIKTGETKRDTKTWQEQLIEHMGITDEGDIVSLVDYEGRAEFDEKLLEEIRGDHDGRGI